MSDWKYAQNSSTERLARLHHFSTTKKNAGGDVELLITVKEFATAETGHMQFFAEAD